MEVVNVTGSTPSSGAPRPHNNDAMWLVGCGNMAGAMVQGWRAAGIDLAQAIAIRPSGTPVGGVRTVRSVADAGGRTPAIALLGFKPQKLDEIAPDLGACLGDETIILSILAGVEVASLRARFPNVAAVVRVMPNLPVAVRRGVIGIYGEGLSELQRDRLSSLLSPLGYAAWCSSEAQLGAIGSVAGAGPAYVARFIDALARAGQEQGLSAELALTIARETVLGTGWLAASTNEAMDEIVRRVRSPKGTTEAGLAVLDVVLPALIEGTIAAAGRRAAELAEQARGIDSIPARP